MEDGFIAIQMVYARAWQHNVNTQRKHGCHSLGIDEIYLFNGVSITFCVSFSPHKRLPQPRQ